MNIPALSPGDSVAVITPASAPKDPKTFQSGLQKLKDLGYKVLVPRENPERRGFLAGHDDVRLKELNDLLLNDDVKALFCARGGYGVTRILDQIDFEAARRYPKLVIGYSDITALHMAFLAKAGWKGLSGPLVVELDVLSPEYLDELDRTLSGLTPGPFTGADQKPLLPLRPGRVDGRMITGNLTLLAQLAGTQYLPDLTGTILVIEEVGEPPYRIDRSFSTLRLNGILDQLGGLVIGSFTETGSSGKFDPLAMTVEDVLDDYLAEAPFPVATGLLYGHYPDKHAMPVGIKARLEVDQHTATLTALEPLTVDPSAPIQIGQ